MTVRFGNITFSDWTSLEYEGGFTDTFIFHIDAMNGLPPFGYRPLLKRMASRFKNKRRGASLWDPGRFTRRMVSDGSKKLPFPRLQGSSCGDRDRTNSGMGGVLPPPSMELQMR